MPLKSLEPTSVRLTFQAEIIRWKGPSPFFFAPIPAEHTDTLRRAGRIASYGWGVIPVEATIGPATFRTSLFPRHHAYLLPVKASARRQANVTVGDRIEVAMTVLTRPMTEPL